MIKLIPLYALIVKQGEVTSSTASDVVVNYDDLYTRREEGTASQVGDPLIAAVSTNDTSNVTIIAAPTSKKRYAINDLRITNRDTIGHTYFVSYYYNATTERRLGINGQYVPAGGSIVLDEVGDVTVVSTTTAATSESEILLSGSTNGKGIKVTQTATAGDLIHTAITGTTGKDYIELWAVNSSSSGVKLTVEFGGASAPDQNIEATIDPEDGLFEITPAGGLPLNNGLTVKAFAASANVIMVYGRVRRVSA